MLNRFQLDNLRRGMPRNNTNGGDSGSTSTSDTTTNNYDKRVAVNSGIGLSADASSITINALDGGAINAALDYANKSFGAAALVANNSVIGAMETIDRGAARVAASHAESLDFANKAFGTASLVANNAVIGALETVDRGAAREHQANVAALDFANKSFGTAALVANNAQVAAFETVDREAARTKDSVDKALAAVAGAGRDSSLTFTQSLDFAKGVFDKGLSVLDTAGKQVEAQAGLIGKAWDNAKGAGAEKQMLMYVAVGAVALVAVVTVWGKR